MYRFLRKKREKMNNKILDFATAGAGAVIGEGIGMLGAENNREGNLRASKDLANYNANIAYDMWNKTNYGAQVEHAKKAGLNPALLYGGSGGGGTTANVGAGGNISGSSQSKGLDLATAKQLELINAQTENVRADTGLKETQAKKLSGADTEKIGAETENLRLQQNVIRADTALKNAETAIKHVEGRVARAQAEDEIEIKAQEAIGARLENKLTEAKTKGELKGIDLKNQTIQSMKTAIAQKYMELTQNQQRIGLEGVRTQIEQFSREMQAKYPSMWNVVGKAMTDFFKGLGAEQYNTENK